MGELHRARMPHSTSAINPQIFTVDILSFKGCIFHIRTSQKNYICPMIKLTQHTLDRLEELLLQAGYTIRNEKGNFKSGSCVLEASKVIVLNKFAPVESKVGFVVEAIQNIAIDESLLDEKNRKLLLEVKQSQPQPNLQDQQ